MLGLAMLGLAMEGATGASVPATDALLDELGDAAAAAAAAALAAS